MARLYIVPLICISYILQPVFSQNKKTYTVKPGEKITSIIPLKDQYSYVSFQNGEVLFKNGYRSAALLNYFIISEEFHFITKTSDTLAVSNPSEISNIVIGNDTYYHGANKFLKRDTVIGEITIATSMFFVMGDIKKIAPFGSYGDGAVDSYELFLPSTNNKMSITPQVLTTLTIRKSLYIGDKHKRFVPVSKKSIFSLFAENENYLQKYLSTNRVNFYSRKDVIDLLVYMQQAK
jgi:hypothetical protein